MSYGIELTPEELIVEALESSSVFYVVYERNEYVTRILKVTKDSKEAKAAVDGIGVRVFACSHTEVQLFGIGGQST